LSAATLETSCETSAYKSDLSTSLVYMQQPASGCYEMNLGLQAKLVITMQLIRYHFLTLICQQVIKHACKLL